MIHHPWFRCWARRTGKRRKRRRPRDARAGLRTWGGLRQAVAPEVLEERRLLNGDMEIHLETVATGLFSPVVATHAGDGSGRIFVAQQGGAVRIVREGTLEPSPFLDLGSGGLNRILADGERGLLGLAFHPRYAVPGAAGEGKFYVYYSAPATLGGNHDSVVSEFQVSALPDAADPASERELLRFRQPFSNHNAGDLHFGPDDGLLYIASGDGGSGGDPENNAQNLGNLLGKILRIDVDGSNAPGGQYGIPASNPFVGQAGAREEIYAWGLRNPYRFSFDDGPTPASADRLFAGDVGQSAFEEIDLVTAGGNYGWRIREGAHPFNTNDPDPGNLIDPIAEYRNDATTDAVIGGYVYRGGRFPALAGRYLFGDLSGKLFVLDEDGGSFSLSEPQVRGGNPIGQNIIAFGRDEAGELYVLTFSSLLAVELRSAHPPWQNQANRLDVNNDGIISPQADALPMINEINNRRISDQQGRLPDPPVPPVSPPPFYDVSGDGLLTPAADVLPIINFLNAQSSPEGESWGAEAALVVPAGFAARREVAAGPQVAVVERAAWSSRPDQRDGSKSTSSFFYRSLCHLPRGAGIDGAREFAADDTGSARRRAPRSAAAGSVDLAAAAELGAAWCDALAPTNAVDAVFFALPRR